MSFSSQKDLGLLANVYSKATDGFARSSFFSRNFNNNDVFPDCLGPTNRTFFLRPIISRLYASRSEIRPLLFQRPNSLGHAFPRKLPTLRQKMKQQSRKKYNITLRFLLPPRGR